MNDRYHHSAVNHVHLTYTPAIVISIYEWPWLSSFRFKPCALDVHTIVISIHEWPLSLFRFESYAFDVHNTVISMHEWPSSLLVLNHTHLTYESRTHHSDMNASLTAIIILFSLCFLTNFRCTMYWLLWFRKRLVDSRATSIFFDWYGLNQV